MRAYQSAAALALAAMLGLSTTTIAQQQDPAAQPPKETKEPVKKKTVKKKKGDDEKKSTKSHATSSQPTLLSQYGDWGAYTATTGGRKVCYTLAKPASTVTEPANKPRDPVYVFISTRPAEKVVNEVSIVIGYPFKSGSDATVDLGSAKFAMYTQADGAWIKDAKEEARMVEAMRKASEMVVSGESGKGTKSTDKYALRGLSQALDRVAQECK